MALNITTATSTMKVIIVITLLLSIINGYKIMFRSKISMSTIDVTKNEYGKKIVTDASKVYTILTHIVYYYYY